VRAATRALGGLHRLLYYASGGRLGARLGGMSILLLTTTGRRTGTPRTIPLTFVRDGGSLVVVGSYGGMDRAPAWWLNLQHNPRASVQIGPLHHEVVARKASPGERARLFAEICARFPVYGRYQQRTTREIPVVILEPAAPHH